MKATGMILIVLLIIGIGITLLSVGIAKKCPEKGGIYMRTAFGMECMEGKVIPLFE